MPNNFYVNPLSSAILNAMLLHLILYVASFIGIWVGSGLAVSSVQRLAARLKISSFAVSFLLLGFFTSISELSVGVNSVLTNTPEVYVGNLVGASIVLFMLVIPLLAITGKQVKIHDDLQGNRLLIPLLVITLPVLLSLDGKITQLDALISLALCVVCEIQIQKKQNMGEKVAHFVQVNKLKISKEVFKIVVGSFIIFLASQQAVTQTLYFATTLKMSPFLISLLVIAIGTNLPELSFVVRSLFMRNNQVALGSYVGSAVSNTFIFGMLTLWYGKEVVLEGNYVISLLALVVGLVLFFVFARSRHTLSRLEGFMLLALYAVFLFTEYVFNFRSQLLTIL